MKLSPLRKYWVSPARFRTVFWLLFVSAFGILPMYSLRAGTINWDGDNGVGNLSYNNNWYGDSNPDNFGGWVYSNNLQFNYNNGNQTSLYWDYSGYRNIGDITFENTYSGNITWDGNGGGLNFNQRFENYSSDTITIGTMNLSGGKNGATQIEFNPKGGDIVLNGNVYNDNSKPYDVYGDNGKTLSLNTTLGTGSNASAVSLTIQQNSIVNVTAVQTYAGGTTINAGTLLANGGVAGDKFGDGDRQRHGQQHRDSWRHRSLSAVT